MKYRKKPVVIEAWQWTFDDEQEKAPQWIKDAMQLCPAEIGNIDIRDDYGDDPELVITTPEGAIYACPGDWITKSDKGELRYCKSSIFDATYEKVEDD